MGSEVSKVLDSPADVATKEVKKAGKCTIPGVCMIKTRVKPATKAGKREIFGKVVTVKAMKARTVVKAFPVAALKKVVEPAALVRSACGRFCFGRPPSVGCPRRRRRRLMCAGAHPRAGGRSLCVGAHPHLRG